MSLNSYVTCKSSSLRIKKSSPLSLLPMHILCNTIQATMAYTRSSSFSSLDQYLSELNIFLSTPKAHSKRLRVADARFSHSLIDGAVLLSSLPHVFITCLERANALSPRMYGFTSTSPIHIDGHFEFSQIPSSISFDNLLLLNIVRSPITPGNLTSEQIILRSEEDSAKTTTLSNTL